MELTKNRKLLLVTVAMLVALSATAIVYAAFSAQSNIVQITVNSVDAVSIVPSTSTVNLGSPVTFTGKATQNSAPYNGATVTLYINGTTSGLAAVTDSNGDYSISWTPNTSGVFNCHVVASAS